MEMMEIMKGKKRENRYNSEAKNTLVFTGLFVSENSSLFV